MHQKYDTIDPVLNKENLVIIVEYDNVCDAYSAFMPHYPYLAAGGKTQAQAVQSLSEVIDFAYEK